MAEVIFSEVKLVEGQPFDRYRYTFLAGGRQIQATFEVFEPTKGAHSRIDWAQARVKEFAAEIARKLEADDTSEGGDG